MDMASIWEEGTIGRGLRGHRDDQRRLLNLDNRPKMTKVRP